jgi:hypothetical protein
MFLVKNVRRALFWFIPQLDSFFDASIETAQLQLALLEMFAEASERAEALASSQMDEIRAKQAELDNWLRAFASSGVAPALPLPLDSDKPIDQIQSSFEQRQSTAEAILWLDSVKCRARTNEPGALDQADPNQVDSVARS